MVTQRRLRRFIVPVALYMAATGVTGFFCYSAYHGSRGIVAKREYKVKIAQLRERLAALQEERGVWERRIALLRSDSLDLDLLEERSRLLLNSAHKNDVILLLDERP